MIFFFSISSPPLTPLSATAFLASKLFARAHETLTTASTSNPTGKCLEIANSLYKSSQFHEATEMYARALKHVGEPASAGALANGHRLTGKQANMCAHLLLGYSRCQRKTGELDSCK